jgi:integrase/recombinase XerC
MSKVCNEYLHDMGFSKTLHTLRHWYGTAVYKALGRDLRQTQELMRHQHISSTECDTWVDPGEAAPIVGRLPSFS